MSRFDGRLRVACSSALLALLVSSIPAAAQVTSEEAACRSKFAKGFAKYMKSTTKAVSTCHKSRNKGDLASSTDCNDPATADAVTGGKAAGAFLKWQSSANDQCGAVTTVLAEFGRCPAPFETSDDGGATTGIDSFDEATTCLKNHLDAGVEEAATTALGAPAVPMSAEVSKCHGTIAKGFAKTIDTIVKTRNKCQSASDKGGGILDFTCSTTPDDTKITATEDKARNSIVSSCDVTPELADSCAATASEIGSCAIDAAHEAGDSLSPTAFELPGICPGSVSVALRHDVSKTDVDIGWTGLHHDEATGSGQTILELDLACDSDCADCAATATVPTDNCRCNGDSSVDCAVNGDCAGFGGTCTCYYLPPTPVNVSGTSLCVTHVLETTAIVADVVPATGETLLELDVIQRAHTPIDHDQPCPVCVGGMCDGGPRDGLACTVDATDPVLGNTSLDCFPNPLANINGVGSRYALDMTAGTATLGFDLACDSPIGAFDCACSTCSGDNSRACNSNATCSAVGAGSCRTDGLHSGEPRRPNSCSDLVCTPTGNGEGECASGPDDNFCSGIVRENGRGTVFCADNSDCDAACGAGGCGTCTVVQTRECLPDPVVATGEPGATLGATGCVAATSNAGINAAFGLPGPFRIEQAYALTDVMCPDDVTPYEAPSGSNCP